MPASYSARSLLSPLELGLKETEDWVILGRHPAIVPVSLLHFQWFRNLPALQSSRSFGMCGQNAALFGWPGPNLLGNCITNPVQGDPGHDGHAKPAPEPTTTIYKGI